MVTTISSWTILDQEEAQPGHRLRAITKTTVTTQNHKYQQFLNQMSATDLWRLQQECTYMRDYTCQRDTGNNNANTPPSLLIIDRISTGPDIPGAHIETLDFKIDRTDHQPIYSRIPLPLRPAPQQDLNPQQQLINPPKKDEAYENLRKELSKHVRLKPTCLRSIRSNQEFDHLYQWVLAVFKHTCKTVFQ